MKKSAINLVFAIIIFIISFFTIIAIYIHFLSANEKYYCYNLYKLNYLNIPEDCKKYIPISERGYLNYSNIDEIEKAIAIYVSRCWARGNRGLKKDIMTCFSLEIIPNIIGNLNFTKIKRYANEYSDIDISRIFVLPNDPDIVSISDRRTILIIYNVTNIIIW